MAGEVQSIRLGPFGGLSGERVDDASAYDGTRPVPMRGGYNVEVRDGEWWVRQGYDFVAATRIRYGSIPWWWIFPKPDGGILLSPYHALSIVDISMGTVQEVYTPVAAAESITFTAGVNTATATTARAPGELILVGASGGTTVVYLIIAVSGGGSTAITLDRVYEAGHPTGAQTCRIIESFEGNPLNDVLFSGENPARDQAAFAVIDQLVSHSAGALYTNSPAVTAGEQYMIVTRRSEEPIAFRTDGGSAVLRNWFRDTSTSSPQEVGDAFLCAAHGNRLLLLGADPTGAYSPQTLWHSMPGDFLIYHTGVAGQNAVPHFKTFQLDDDVDTFQAIVPLGELLVVHRRLSQEVGYPQGSSIGPYQWRRYSVGSGLTSTRAIAQANGAHYLVTDHGLCVFDGAALQPLFPEMEEHLQAMQCWNKVRFLLAVEDEQRIYGFAEMDVRHQAAAIPATANVTIASGSSAESWQSTQSVWVYDYKENHLWLEDHVTPAGLQGKLGGNSNSGQSYFLCRFDGTILALTNSGTGFDRGVTTGTHVVDAFVETPWLSFGDVDRKRIQRVVAGLRPLDLTTGAAASSITDLWTLPGETLHLCTIEVFADGRLETAGATSNSKAEHLSKLVSEMLALLPDENQQMPVFEMLARNLDVAGRTFKFRIKNALPAGSTATKGMFRLAYLEVYFSRLGETGEPLAPGNPLR